MGSVPTSLSFISVMEDLLADVFNEYLLPIILIAFDFVWDLAVGMIQSALNHLFFRLWTTLLKVLLILERIFDVFSCTVGVYVQDQATGAMTATSGAGFDVTQSRSLIDVLLQSDPVVNAGLGMTAGAFALCFLITIIAVIRSVGEGIGELKRPVSHVMRQTSRACLTFAIIPIACIFAVKLAGVTLSTITLYMPQAMDGSSTSQKATLVSEALSNLEQTPRRGSKQSSIEKAIAATRVATATEDTRACDLIFYLMVKDALRNPDNEQYYLSGQHFQNETVALQDVDVSMINWLYAFFETLLVIIIFLKLIIECMVRIFMILILFLVAPYFVAMMPLDDGAKFKRWKEMFTGFTVSVFGPVLAMRLYLILLPYIVTNNGLDLGFGTSNVDTWRATVASVTKIGYSVQAVSMTENLFRLFFIAAGGFAVYKSQNLILDIINPDVGKLLAGSSSVIDKSIGAGMKAATSGLSGAVGKGISALKGMTGGGGK